MGLYLALFILITGNGFANAKRIVGGEETTIEKYPSLVQVEMYTSWAEGQHSQNPVDYVCRSLLPWMVSLFGFNGNCVRVQLQAYVVTG
ncbi:unnamed protein product [Leptosia nina]|uniref:Uncharacterized protein n=1 Tax=Leptosia nina TaxID=320188 RepID=A0AAV1J8F9_9NEOP